MIAVGISFFGVCGNIPLDLYKDTSAANANIRWLIRSAARMYMDPWNLLW